jgi:hypothetical protein
VEGIGKWLNLQVRPWLRLNVIVLDKIIVYVFFIKKSQFSLVKGTNLNKYIQNGGQLYKLFSFVFMTQDIDRFHLTSRRPYWCTKTMKWRPYWCTVRELALSYSNISYCFTTPLGPPITWVKTIYYGRIIQLRIWLFSICCSPKSF